MSSDTTECRVPGLDVPDGPGSEEGPAGRTVVDGVDVLGSLSPSRAADFMACPLLFRFRTVDRLPEPPSPVAVRGSVVHKVLEDLFDLPAPQRTAEHAAALLAPAWAALVAAEPALAEMFDPDAPDGGGGEGGGGDGEHGGDGDGGLDALLSSCLEPLGRYFTLEDPTHLEPAEREAYVEALLDSRLLLRGFVDRLDVTSAGEIRVVDYKTGRAPAEGYESKALFQMRFYALVLWKTRGVVPRMLQLVYLGSGEILRYCPDEQDLRATERKVEALWRAIATARETGDWRPSPSALCGWCAHRSLCPEWGGTPPPLPAAEDDPCADGTAEPAGRPS
jgi:putative RecB family exonuclease